jgi:trimeric autotransporter adhesin
MTSRGSFEFRRSDILSSSSGVSKSLSKQRLSSLQEQQQFQSDPSNGHIEKSYSPSSYTASTISSSSSMSNEITSNASLALMTPELLRMSSGESGLHIKKTWSFRSNNSDIKSTSSDSMSIAGSSSPMSSSHGFHSKRSSRTSGIHLDPIDTSSIGSVKSRPSSMKTAPINSLSTNKAYEPMVYSVTWSDGVSSSSRPSSHAHTPISIHPESTSPMNVKSDEGSPATPTTSSESNSPSNLNNQSSLSTQTKKEDSTTRLSSYLFSMTNYSTSKSSSTSNKSESGPNNRLPPMDRSSSISRQRASAKAESPTPGCTSPSRKRPDQQQTSPLSKPRPLSARMSSLISIFSRSESLDSPVRQPSPPKATKREMEKPSLAGSRRTSLSRRQLAASSEPDAMSDLVVRNLDTGQVINLDKRGSGHFDSSLSVPSTIPPNVLLRKGKVRQGIAMPMTEPAPIPPLFKEMDSNNMADGYIVRTL